MKNNIIKELELSKRIAKLVRYLHFYELPKGWKSKLQNKINELSELYNELHNNPEFLKDNSLFICKHKGCNREFKTHRGLMSHKTRSGHYY